MASVETPTRRASSARPPKRPAPWWGSGEPPDARWPGVSLTFDAQWSTRNNRWETHQGRYFYDPVAAKRALEFFPLFLKHHMGEFAGQPFVLRADQDLLLTRPIFGWKRLDGTRRFRKVFAFCPKGYGKSPWAAGVGLYLARYDNEPAAEVYAVAADREQARIVHTNAKVFVESDSDLSQGCEVWRDAIVWSALHATYKVLSAEATAAHGYRPHGVLFDELHAQKDRNLFEALRKSMAKRRQPLLVIITHAGTDDESICFEEYDLAKRILAEQTDHLEATLPVIFEMSPSADWTDPTEWARVNPGHGTTIKHDQIVEECHEALAEPRKRNDFLRYHGNRWTNQATAWIPIEWWDACQSAFTDADLAGLDVCAGLDLAQKWDLAAFALVFRKPLETPTRVEVVTEDEKGTTEKKAIELNYELFVKPWFWIPEETLQQHVKEDAVPYDIWRQQGLITVTEGAVIDYSRIYQDITTKILPRFPKLKQGLIAYDPAFATDLAVKLRDVGGLQILEVLQNYKMLSEPSQIIEALIKGKRIDHDGHRVLRWNWEQIAIKTDDAGRIRPVKPKQQHKRIDGAVAMIMGQKALSAMVPQPSFRVVILR